MQAHWSGTCGDYLVPPGGFGPNQCLWGRCAAGLDQAATDRPAFSLGLPNLPFDQAFARSCLSSDCMERARDGELPVMETPKSLSRLLELRVHSIDPLEIMGSPRGRLMPLKVAAGISSSAGLCRTHVEAGSRLPGWIRRSRTRTQCIVA